MNNIFRTALALAAAVVVAGPALVLANIPNATYVASSTVLLGPASVAAGSSTAAYSLRVTFSGPGAPAPITYTGTPVTFSASSGSFGGDNVFEAPASPGFVVVAGQLNSNVRATRLVRVQ